MPPPEETHPELAVLLAGLNGGPDDGALWLIIADWLEEQGQPERAELTRLNLRLRDMKKGPKRAAAEDRVRTLVNGGVRPSVQEGTNPDCARGRALRRGKPRPTRAQSGLTVSA